MRKISLSFAALAALMMVGVDTPVAEAGHGGFGLYVGGSNVRLDIGNPNGRRCDSPRSTVYRRPYSNPRWYGYGGGAHYDRHDTRRYGYVPPGRYVPYGNYYGYAPPRHVLHRGGYRDVPHGRHPGDRYGEPGRGHHRGRH